MSLLSRPEALSAKSNPWLGNVLFMQPAHERTTLAAQIDEVRLQAQTEASELDKSRALLAQESAEQQGRTKIIVTAPVAGTITAVAAQTGQNLAGGVLLATLLPVDTNGQSNALEAHFYATTRQAGFVEKGQTVLLRYAAYPHQKFGMRNGEVTEISRSPYVVQEFCPHTSPPRSRASLRQATRCTE